MHRLNVIDSTDHLPARLVVLAKPIFKRLHISTHRLNGRAERSNQTSPNRHASIELTSYFHRSMPTIADDSLRVFPMRMQAEHLFSYRIAAAAVAAGPSAAPTILAPPYTVCPTSYSPRAVPSMEIAPFARRTLLSKDPSGLH